MNKLKLNRQKNQEPENHDDIFPENGPDLKEIPKWKPSSGHKLLELKITGEFKYSPMMAVSTFIWFIKRITSDDIDYLDKYCEDFYYLSNHFGFRQIIDEGNDLSELILHLWDNDSFSDNAKKYIMHRSYLSLLGSS